MEERILFELGELKRLTLLSAKNVLTLDDVVLLTGLSKSAIYKKTCLREIPHFRQGKFLYFNRNEIEAWMQSNRVASTHEIQSDALTYCRNKRRV